MNLKTRDRGHHSPFLADRIVPPNATTEAVLLAQAMGRKATLSATLGGVFAERAEAACR